jgi:myo-inositol 2-dehydrogenase/D-chiro-inositol 1-dehydrogenase
VPQVGLAVIGCGSIACWVHLRVARRLHGARLVGAADPDPVARQRAARLTGLAIDERTDDLLARPEVEAVIVTGPTHLHADLAVAACAAGKHVYIEKPLASTSADAARVVDAARRAGVTVALGFNRRFHPLFEQARAVLREGRLGRIRSVHTTFCEPVPADAMPAWKRRRASGGGVLLDLASHHVDLLRWLLADEVATVDAARLGSDDSEQDSAHLQLAMRSGARVQSFFSFRSALGDAFEISGELATLRVDRHRPALSLRLPRRLGYGTRTAWLAPGPPLVTWWLDRLLRPSRDPSYRRALRAFVDVVRGRPRDLASLADGMRALEVVEAAEESARRGAQVAVGAG